MHVLSSEGGHVGMAVVDHSQFEFEQFIKEKMGLKDNFVSSELLFCEQGIPYIYQYHAQKEGKQTNSVLTGKEIFSNIDHDPIAKLSFDHFLKMLGTTLAHLAAAFLPDEGIFLCGSIVGEVLQHILQDTKKPDSSKLISAFVNNKCLGSYLESVPIYFTPDVGMGMKGCWNFLQLIHK